MPEVATSLALCLVYKYAYLCVIICARGTQLFKRVQQLFKRVLTLCNATQKEKA